MRWRRWRFWRRLYRWLWLCWRFYWSRKTIFVFASLAVTDSLYIICIYLLPDINNIHIRLLRSGRTWRRRRLLCSRGRCCSPFAMVIQFIWIKMRIRRKRFFAAYETILIHWSVHRKAAVKVRDRQREIVLRLRSMVGDLNRYQAATTIRLLPLACGSVVCSTTVCRQWFKRRFAFCAIRLAHFLVSNIF